jgi:hypothetical protein
MGTIFFTGNAEKVAQVSTVQITGYDAATIYKLTINGIIVAVTGDTDVNTTATNLGAAVNAATHIYFSTLTATVATDTVTITTKTASKGMPFVVTSSVAGGAGTIGAVATPTAATGPNHYDNADNWSAGAVPVAADIPVLANSDVNICWGMDQSGVALDGFYQRQSYTGRVGLNYAAYATTSDGVTVNTTAEEYRVPYLQIRVDAADGDCVLGQQDGTGGHLGSGRILLGLGANAANIRVLNTAATSVDSGRPAVRLIAGSSSTDVFVDYAPGGVGLAAEVPGEASSCNDVVVNDTSSATRVVCGDGLTVAGTWTTFGGHSVIRQAADGMDLTVKGGTVRTEGTWALTDYEIYDGTAILNNEKAASSAMSTGTLYGGVTDGTGSSAPRVWSTITPKKGSTLKMDKDIVTITNALVLPVETAFTLTIE